MDVRALRQLPLCENSIKLIKSHTLNSGIAPQELEDKFAHRLF